MRRLCHHNNSSEWKWRWAQCRLKIKEFESVKLFAFSLAQAGVPVHVRYGVSTLFPGNESGGEHRIRALIYHYTEARDKFKLTSAIPDDEVHWIVLPQNLFLVIRSLISHFMKLIKLVLSSRCHPRMLALCAGEFGKCKTRLLGEDMKKHHKSKNAGSFPRNNPNKVHIFSLGHCNQYYYDEYARTRNTEGTYVKNVPHAVLVLSKMLSMVHAIPGALRKTVGNICIFGSSQINVTLHNL